MSASARRLPEPPVALQDDEMRNVMIAIALGAQALAALVTSAALKPTPYISLSTEHSALSTIGLTQVAPKPTGAAADLLAQIKRTTVAPETAARNAKLKQLADQLDRLPDTELDTKIQGHFALETVDATVRRHATWLIEGAKTWDAARRKTYASRLVNSYVELAGALAEDGEHDTALALLRGAPAALPEVTAAGRRTAGLLTRLELIGTVGAPLTAPRWLNMPAGTTSLDLKGKVTLIEFSAHWCGPCTTSYPSLNRFRQTYGARGFQTAIATELYGYFGADKSLTQEVELARDRAYFAKHGLNIPVAIGNEVTVTYTETGTTYSPARDPNHLNYRAGALPQFYLLDRQGRIRFILSGWGRSSEAKLSKLIRVLLDESGHGRDVGTIENPSG